MKNYVLIFFVCTYTLIFGQSSDKYNSIYANYYRAEELFQKEQYGSARTEFRAFINQMDKKQDPLYVKALYYEGISALELFNNDAVSLLENFNKNYPESIYHNEIYFRLGKYFYQKKDFTGTLKWLNQLKPADVERDNLSEFYFKLGYANFQESHFPEARNAFYEIKDDSSQYGAPALYYFSHINYQDKNYQTALDGFLKLQDSPSFSKVVPYYIVQIYHLQKRYREVTEYAPNVMDTSNLVNMIDINHLVGDAFYRIAKYDEAVVFLERYDKEAVTTRDDDYELGYSYLKSTNYKEAIRLFDRVTQTRDSLGQIAYYHIGEAYLKMEKLGPARAAFNEASLMTFDPKIQKDALYNFAVLSYKLDINPYDEAVEALQLYLNKYPDSERKNDIYQYLVNVYTTTNKFGKALQSLDKLEHKDIRLKTAYQIVAYNYGIELYQNAKYGEAISTLELVDKYPIDVTISAKAKFWIGDANFQLKKYDKAIQGYRAYINANGLADQLLKADAYYNIGYAYYAKRDTTSGVENFRIYTQTVPYNKATDKNKLADAYIRAAEGYYILHQDENAVKFYKGAIELHAGYEDQALFYLAKTYTYIQGKTQEKIETLLDLINNYTDSKYTLYAVNELAVTYKFMGNNDQSLKYYQLIITDYPNSMLVRNAKIEVADIYYKKHEFAKCETAYKEFLEEYGDEREFCERGSKGLYDLYNEIRRYEDAKQIAEKYACAGISKDQQERDLYYMPAMKYYNDTTKTAEAIMAFDRYLATYPNGIYVADVKNFKADCFYRLKEYEKSIALYQEILAGPTSGITELAAIRVSKYFYNNQKYKEAIPYYERLESISSTPSIVFNSRLGLMRSYFIVENWKKAADYAKLLADNSQVNATIRLEVEYVRGMANATIENFVEAKPSLEWVIKNTTTEQASEARFTIAEMYFKQKEFDKSDTEIRLLLKMKPSYNYWVAKGLILQAKISMQKNDLFQAEQTLKSVKEHYPVQDDGILNEANEVWDELMQLKNKPKDVQPVPPTEIEVNEN